MRFAIALGSNLGDRLATMRDAVRRIASFASVVATSHVYETKSVGAPGPDYLNAAILVEWDGRAIDLLDRLQEIEHELGRVRTTPNAPRTLDLDILWIDGAPIATERLVVPHPRLLERAFALRPLLDVVPDAYLLPPGMIEDPACRRTPEALA